MAKVVSLEKEVISDTYSGVTYSYEYYNINATCTATDTAHTTYADLAAFMSANTTHNTDDFIAITSLKRVFRCSADGTQGKLPPAYPSLWTDYGAINSFAAFDNTLTSQVESDVDFTITFEFNRINTIALLNMENMTSVRIRQSGTDIDKTVSLRDYGALSLYDLWYQPIKDVKNFKLIDLEWLPSSTVTLDFTVSGVGKIGAVVSGYLEDLGATLYGSSVGFDDNSVYESDEYGIAKHTKRPAIDVIDAKVIVDNNEVDYVIAKLKERRGTTSLYIGDERDHGFESMTVLGYIKKIRVPIENPSKTEFPISIIGVA